MSGYRSCVNTLEENCHLAILRIVESFSLAKLMQGQALTSSNYKNLVLQKTLQGVEYSYGRYMAVYPLSVFRIFCSANILMQAIKLLSIRLTGTNPYCLFLISGCRLYQMDSANFNVVLFCARSFFREFAFSGIRVQVQLQLFLFPQSLLQYSRNSLMRCLIFLCRSFSSLHRSRQVIFCGRVANLQVGQQQDMYSLRSGAVPQTK